MNVAILCCRQSEKKPAKAPQKYGCGMETKNGKKRSGSYSRSAAQLAGTRAETQQSGNPKKQPPAERDAGRKTPITAADLLNGRVLPFFDEKEVTRLELMMLAGGSGH